MMNGLSSVGNSDSRTNGPAEVTVVIPVFNEEEGVAEVVRRLIDVCRGRGWQILVVDDGSTDGTSAVLAGFGQDIRVIRHPVNVGYGAALKTGILRAQAETVICLDADGQHDPELVPEFARRLQTADYVVGVRRNAKGVPLSRRPGKWLLRHVVSFLVGRPVIDFNCGFRGGRRRVFLRMLSLLPDGFSFSTTSLVYVLKSRVAVDFVDVAGQARAGVSSVRMVQDGSKCLLLAVRLIMLFDPLRAIIPPAAALVVVGLLYQVYILIYYGLHIEGGAILTIIAGIVLFHFALLSDQVASLRKELASEFSIHDELEEHATRPADRA